MRILSVCPTVRPSVTRVYCDKTEERSVQIFSDENSVRLSVCPSVRPSVCLSVRRVICDKMEERSVQIFIPYERTFSLVF